VHAHIKSNRLVVSDRLQVPERTNQVHLTGGLCELQYMTYCQLLVVTERCNDARRLSNWQWCQSRRTDQLTRHDQETRSSATAKSTARTSCLVGVLH